jgi:S1-C subfamily serine protease
MNTRRFLSRPLALAIGLTLLQAEAANAGFGHLRESVVKIYVTLQQEDFQQPWQAHPPVGGNGSGFILKGKRIMTNAHVVSDARFIEVQREGDPRKYEARVAFAGHDCDLAILTVNDGSFFRDTRPIAFGPALPSLNDEVVVMGYPMGGERLSLTRGVVSRIDYGLYAHSTVDSHLVLQVDAAINPGNSGGPVLFKGRVIGLAFQGLMGAQSIGYAIPLPVIERFLTDIADGAYDGYPELGVEHLESSNPALRSSLGIPPDAGGVVVTYVDPFGAAEGRLKPRDVLLAIDGHPIAADGSVRLDGNAVEYAELIERKQCGQSARFAVWRDNAEQDITVPLTRGEDPFIFRQTYDRQPEYVIAGGLVFSPLSRGYLATLGGDLNTPAAQRLLYLTRFAKLDNLHKGRTQFVVLTGRLPHPVNTYCEGYRNLVLTSVNGQEIRSIADLPPALAKPQGGFHVLRFLGHDNPLILDARLSAAAEQEILAQYHIQARSHIEPGAPTP